MAGRIAGIADVFDALTSDRVYRPAMPVEEAIDYLVANRGNHFDPALVDLFVSAAGEIEEIRASHPDAPLLVSHGRW